MVALFSPILSPNYMGWSIDDYIIQQQQFGDTNNSITDETSYDTHFLVSPTTIPPPPPPPRILERCDSVRFEGNSGGSGGGDDVSTVKKLCHNASERDRRKKMNELYSSLRSLLPTSDQKATRLSIPNTVSRVVKYIPELQKELAMLQKKKQQLITTRPDKVMTANSLVNPKKVHPSPEFNKRRKVASGSHQQSHLSASQVGERDIVIQICTKMGNNNNSSFADALSCLEQEGMLLLHSSTLQTSQDTVKIYTLHLQVQGNEVMKVDKLKEKLLMTYFNDNEEQHLLSRHSQL